MWEDRILTCTVEASSRVLIQEQKELLVGLLSILPRISESHVLECPNWVSNDVEVVASALFDLFNKINEDFCAILFEQVEGVVLFRAGVDFNAILRSIA